MRLSSLALLCALASLPALGCYQQPVISPDKPLTCSNPDAAGECPKGFNCIGNRICARRTCATDDDCPAELVCTGRGCVLPGTDSGTPPITAPGFMTEAGAPRGDAQEVDAPPGLPDAGLTPDAAVTAIPDAAGGGGN